MQKITFHGILAKETSTPYSFEDFHEYLHKEHSNENIELWSEVMSYCEKAQPVYGATLASFSFSSARRRSSFNSITASFLGIRRISSNESQNSPSSSSQRPAQLRANLVPINSLTIHSDSEEDTQRCHSISKSFEHIFGSGTIATGKTNQTAVVDDEFLNSLKADLDHILSTFIYPGSRKEVNIPGILKKNLIMEVRSNKNYNPEIFRPAMEIVIELMKNHSYPQFLLSVAQHQRDIKSYNLSKMDDTSQSLYNRTPRVSTNSQPQVKERRSTLKPEGFGLGISTLIKRLSGSA